MLRLGVYEALDLKRTGKSYTNITDNLLEYSLDPFECIF